MSENANQTKYGAIKAANFVINHWNHGWKKWHENVFSAYEGNSVTAERFIRALTN